ncbi:MAG: hypothetical protein ACLUFL_02435 [Flavonifractor plautii]
MANGTWRGPKPCTIRLKLGHMSNLFYTQPCAYCLPAVPPGGMSRQPSSPTSGAEANEGLIKLARKYSFDKYGEGDAIPSSPCQLLPRPDDDHPAATGQDVISTVLPLHQGFRYAGPMTDRP